jgi:hypothetical protein
LLALRRILDVAWPWLADTTNTWTNFPADGATPAVRLKISASFLDPSTPIEVKTTSNSGIDDVSELK